MISSIVISQLIDENKSEENGAALPGPCTVAQPHMHPVRQSLANRHGVALSRAFAFLPGRLGLQTLAKERGPETEPPPQEEKPCSGPQKGFASITITARRVGTPASSLGWEALGNSLCPKCRAQDTLLTVPSAWASGAHPRRHHGHITCTEFSQNSSVMRLKVPAAHARLREGHKSWVTHVESREDGFPPGSPRPGRGPLVFSSCVHLRVSQQCPHSIYYLDRSLSVPMEQPQLVGPKMHRSVLSLNLNCSSCRLTPDGADGTANRGPLGSVLPEMLTEGTPDLLAPHWSPGLPESFLKENPSLGPLPLGMDPCPRGGSSLLENIDFTDVGTDRVTIRKGQEDHVPRCHTGGRANQLSIHIPGWSYMAEAKEFSGISKEQPREARVASSAPPMEQRLVKGLPPDGCSSPSNSCQSSNFLEPTESQRPSSLKPRVPLAGSCCPLRALCASPQEDSGVQIGGDCTRSDLVVKIKECKRRQGPTMPKPEPKPAALEPASTTGPEVPALSEDCWECQQTPASSLTLQEALQVHKPQFISRSQERLKKLEHMVQQRKAQQKDNLGPKQSLLPVRANKKQCTVPHPLSDNLFKPRERYISEKEMHMRSKRIYDNLPEVKKKKEEQRKRVILQSNRLRAEVFKKQLLDKLLQRNAV